MTFKAWLIGGTILVAGFAAQAQTVSETPAAAATVSERAEMAIWEMVSDAPTDIALDLFLQQFPDGVYAEDARQQLIALRRDTADASAANVEPAVAVAEPAVVAAEPAQDVSFAAPLLSTVPHISGKSIEQLAQGSPLFTPVAELPEAYWKDRQCASCHAWEKANLCDQAEFYASDRGQDGLATQHPYGGGFKQSLRDWAVGGCQ